MNLKKMGVINITPNSFSDGGELSSAEKVLSRLTQFGTVDAIDLGAESTAPMNASISWEEEWERIRTLVHLWKHLSCSLSFDTYHPETIFKIIDVGFSGTLLWNDISGKFDESVREYLKLGEKFHYVFCHNRAPTRALSGRHMDYQGEINLEEYFSGKEHPRVIFDPCLGFSKTYEQNWQILESFGDLQKKFVHNRWLIGFSRKSFLRKKFNLDFGEELDRVHVSELERLSKNWSGEVWVRTHRPELLP